MIEDCDVLGNKKIFGGVWNSSLVLFLIWKVCNSILILVFEIFW